MMQEYDQISYRDKVDAVTRLETLLDNPLFNNDYKSAFCVAIMAINKLRKFEHEDLE